jgi:hypothetical protein
VRLSEDLARLLADLVEGAPHDRRAQARRLELGDELRHLRHVAIDRLAVVAAQREGKVGVGGRLGGRAVQRGPRAR